MNRISLTRTLCAAGLAAAFLLTGCSDDEKGSWEDGKPKTEASADAAAAETLESAEDSPLTAGDAEAAADPNRCKTEDLDVKISAATDSSDADGEDVVKQVKLVFTNKSGKECNLNGYPLVAWATKDQGVQVNDSFERDIDVPRQKVALAPNSPAHAVLVLHGTDEYDDEECKPQDIGGLRVSVPHEKAVAYLDSPQKVCSASGVNVAQVQPVVSGA